ncbi:molecular chaperone DnaK [Candidatus Bipolaricaulota bacterium]|nr:molecular chaperone DnaK [Candidatus Bipolaricaulota bacterium]TFH10474.1 MAG: molecular chaperone DnaK [Candidatus Atribacteria bacterium]
MKEKIIGIDLGTTNSCAAVLEGGSPEIITNSEGERITPSVVAFTASGERLAGRLAKRQAITNPYNTIASIKREMGTDHRVKITIDGKVTDYTPEQISAMILQKLKADAEAHLGGKVNKAVITVPAYFNDSQRQATKDAGAIAGLEVMRIINEPTAAALAYGLDKDHEQTILVYDLGGGTFDVSILEIGDGVFDVLASDGDTRLGGDDFDQRIIDWLAEEFRKDTGIDLSSDASAMQRLKDAAESAKKELSSRMETTINLPYITADASGPKHMEKKLSRAKFESMIDDLLQRTIQVVDATLREAGKDASTIDQVVLVGGSTRIPMVQTLISGRIPGKINREINPDEVVAAGAAIQGGILAGEVDQIVLLDVTPLTLSIETLGGIATPLIERNTTIPTEKSKIFTTAEDSQPAVQIHVVQGERKMVSDNKSLGTFQLTGIPPAPRGIPQIEVTFNIDADGILHVTAKDKATNTTASITIQDSSRLDDSEIERMRREAEVHADEDKKKAELIEVRNQADQLIYAAEKAMSDLGEKVDSGKRSEIEDQIRRLREKLSQDASVEDLKASIATLSKASQEIGQQAYQETSQEGAAPNAPSGEDSATAEGEYIDAEYDEQE